MLNIVLQLAVFTLLNSAKALNILVVFPIPSINPEHMFTTLIQEIANRGHGITLVTAKQVFTNGQALQNITTIDVHYKLNTIWQKYNNIIMSDKNRDIISELSLTLETTNYFYEELLQTDEFRTLIKDNRSNFDVLLLEATMIPLLGLSDLFNVPVILVSPTGAMLNNYETIGAPNHPFLYPAIFHRRIYNLTLFEKVIQTSTYIRLKSKILSSEKKVEVMLKKHFGHDFLMPNKLSRNVFALFLNSNPIWDGNRPVTSNVVFMGGIQPRNMEELPQVGLNFIHFAHHHIHKYFTVGFKPPPAMYKGQGHSLPAWNSANTQILRRTLKYSSFFTTFCFNETVDKCYRDKSGTVPQTLIQTSPLTLFKTINIRILITASISHYNFQYRSSQNDLHSFLDKSRIGVIYFSFGSNIKPSQLSPKKLLMILNVLSEISFDVVLKWDNTKIPRTPKNIKIYNWLPQSSLLAHPNIKLFITQGSIQSTFEAIKAGVPLIGLPMYSDQWYNTEKYNHFHIGLQMDLASMTEGKFKDAIYLVIRDKSYRNSIADLRALMFEQPEISLERAIWWTEQVLRPYGIQHLSSPAANMSWTEYLELDFIFFILLVIFFIILVILVFITLIIRYTFGSIADMRKKIR